MRKYQVDITNSSFSNILFYSTYNLLHKNVSYNGLDYGT